MSPSMRRLAVAGCVLSAVFMAPASFAAVDALNQPIQNLPKINLLQTVTHISNPLGKKDVQPKTISRTDKWRFVMAEAAVRKDQPVFDPMATYLAFESFKDAPGPLFTGHRIDCMTGEAAEREQRIKGFANVAKLCAQLREVSADVQRDPEQLRDDSDRGILGVYTAILDLKINNRQVRKEKINEQTALRLVDAYASLAENEGMKDRAGVVSFQLPDIPNVTFNASAGMMVDVGFTRAQLAHESKGAIPAESKLSPAAFEQMQRACTENKGTIETFGACLDIGNAEYSNYLRKNRLVVSVRGG